MLCRHSSAKTVNNHQSDVRGSCPAGPSFTFLETYFTVEHDRIEYRLKNANEGDVKRVWRYQSWESYSPSEQKRRTLVATLQKVAAMASNEKEMVNSAMAKLREFADLGYPASVRKDACCRVASSGGGAIWIVVALTQR